MTNPVLSADTLTEEQKRLNDFTYELQRQIERLERPEEFANNADAWITHCIQRVIGSPGQRSAYLQVHLARPYHARLIFEQSGNVHDMYVGRYDATYAGVRVVDWRAPVAELLHPQASRRQSYGHYPPVYIRLKRTLSVENSQVLDYADLTPYAESWNSGATDRQLAPAPTAPPPDPASPTRTARTTATEHSSIAPPEQVSETPSDSPFSEWETADTLLLSRLNESSDHSLRDIVETIQQEQDALIRADLKRPLIVNGVAGSGKTSVAYHRLALLLYPEYRYLLSAQRIMVFAPNRFSLSYLKQLLPHLGVNGVQQATLTDWMLAQLNLKECQVGDVTLELLLSPQATPAFRARTWRKAQIRGRREVMDLCRLHLVKRTVDLVPAVGLQVDLHEGKRSIKLHVRAEQIQQAIRAGGGPTGRSFTELRTAVGSKLNEVLFEALARQGISTEAASFRTFESIRQALRRIEQVLFPSRDTLEETNLLFGSRAYLRTFAGPLFNPEEIDALHFDTELTARPPTTLDITELPLMMAMHLVLRREAVRSLDKFDYTVIDEGQDVSSLQYLILSHYTQPGQISVFGDLMQGIHAYRGITSWEPVLNTFRVHPEDSVHALTRTYRSTREIVELGNQIIRQHHEMSSAAVYLAKAVGRSGDPPRIQPCQNMQQMLSHLTKEISEHLQAGYQNIGVITKSAARADMIAVHFRTMNLPFTVSDPQTQEYRGGVTVLPVTLAKGLEFDVALVVDADEHHYAADPYDARMLYVAVTRGMHCVSLYTAGTTLTPLLTLPSAPDTSGN